MKVAPVIFVVNLLSLILCVSGNPLILKTALQPQLNPLFLYDFASDDPLQDKANPDVNENRIYDPSYAEGVYFEGAWLKFNNPNIISFSFVYLPTSYVNALNAYQDKNITFLFWYKIFGEESWGLDASLFTFGSSASQMAHVTVNSKQVPELGLSFEIYAPGKKYSEVTNVYQRPYSVHCLTIRVASSMKLADATYIDPGGLLYQANNEELYPSIADLGKINLAVLGTSLRPNDFDFIGNIGKFFTFGSFLPDDKVQDICQDIRTLYTPEPTSSPLTTPALSASTSPCPTPSLSPSPSSSPSPHFTSSSPTPTLPTSSPCLDDEDYIYDYDNYYQDDCDEDINDNNGYYYKVDYHNDDFEC